MKLHRLELTGFGPFRDTQVVDFDAFDADGLFLISGRTGTGKSSILDGVSFALYGTVPRYDGGEKRLRSDHAYLTDPTEVTLEFTVGAQRWRVTRAPEYDRPAKRGGGLTTEPPRAELAELVDGVWVGRAAKPRTVGEALAEILGLNAQQFQQVILLAQNKFSRFLLASGEERQGLLRTLFGTLRFERYRDDLDQRRRDAERARAAVDARALTLIGEAERLVHAQGLDGSETADAPASDAPASETPASETPASEGPGAVAAVATAPAAADPAARRDHLDRAHDRARYRVEQAELARAAADERLAHATSAHAAVTAAAERARERVVLRDRLAALEGRAGEIAHERQRLERAREASTLRAPLDARERTERAVAVAIEDAAAARARWRPDSPDSPTSPDSAAGPDSTAGPDSRAGADSPAGADSAFDAAAAVERLTGDLARWEIAAAQEKELVARRDEHAAASASLVALEDELAVIDARRAAVPAARAALDAESAELHPRAARHDDLQRAHERLLTIVDAARLADERAAALADAESAYAAALTVSDAASAHLGALLRRRLDGIAGELATSLVSGEPCPVCGSAAHPHPAPPADDPITDDVLAAAEAARDAAAAAEVRARERAVSAREALAQARIAADGLDRAAAEERLAAVAAERADADRAVAALDEVRARRDALDAAAADDAAAHAGCLEKLAVARERARAAEEEIARLDVLVADARGSFETVAARIHAATAERDRARAVVAADAAREERVRARDDARREFAVLLAASGFDDVDGVRSALIDDADLARIEAAVAEHAAQLSATRSRLLDLELDAVGEETGDDVGDDDVVVSRAAVAAADAARADAISAHATAVRTAEALADVLQQIDRALAAARDGADEAAAVIRLADSVAGRAPNTMRMDLETFVLAAELEEIVAAANVRLAEMSSGRYTLHHSDARAARGRASGLGIDVLDAHTGRLRPPQSLSGGETFLASLALALGLGEVVTARAGGIRLDTLFVDEGFGSLDPETLELALRTLDDLRTGGRTVGVISHVEAMKEQLPAQLWVASTPEGPSIIRQDAARALSADRAR